MEYRLLPKTDTKISTVGIGSGHLIEAEPKEIERLLAHSYEQDINFLDLAVPYEQPLTNIASAIKGKREDWLYQMHLGCIFKNGQYVRSRDRKDVQEGFENQLRILGTDYTDFGFIHCVDEEEDFNTILESGVFEYARTLKKQGKIRYLGFASHTGELCSRFLDTGEIDAFLFSINPAYDHDATTFYPMQAKAAGDYVSVSENRAALYRRCEAQGIGITVMKAFAGGRLLDERTSPFGQAMTIPQCLQYALDQIGRAHV